MKFKVGDKIKYDSGEWQFFGTVSAIIENSINPCYRLNVDRMEKRNCKFSITQFEFELEPDHEMESETNLEIEYLKRLYNARKNDNSGNEVKSKSEKSESKLNAAEKQRKMPEQKPEKTEIHKRSQQAVGDKWITKFEMYRKGTRDRSLDPWKYQIRKLYKEGNLPDAKYEKLKEINFPFERTNKKREGKKKNKIVSEQIVGDKWNENLELYKKGEKSNAINVWIYTNRKQYKDGDLSEAKYAKLKEINFPFETVRKPDSWEKRLEEWKKGDTRSKYAQAWRQRSIRQYLKGKLSEDRIAQLKKVGILK